MVHLLNREREKIIPLQQNEVLLPTATLMFTSIDARRSLRRIEISRKITFEFRTSGEQRVDTTMEYSKLEKVLLFFHPCIINNIVGRSQSSSKPTSKVFGVGGGRKLSGECHTGQWQQT